jgi:hypothetical protein
MQNGADLAINETSYRWCVRVFSFLYNRLGITITLHDHANLAQDGQIFLFNHFARFETVVPQYLLYKETEAYCRCVASAEFFQGNDSVANFLRGVGAVPNDLEGILPFLAAEVLRGRKIIMFPDRYSVVLVLNEYGDFLSDMACGLAGSMGIGASSSLSFTQYGDVHLGMFDPAGGTAPDIAGQNVVNPTAMLLALSMLFFEIDQRDAGQQLKDSVLDLLRRGIATRDLGGSCTTTGFAEAVADELTDRLAATAT